MSCFAIISIKGKETQRINVTDNSNALDEYLSKEYSGYFSIPTEKAGISDVEEVDVKPVGKDDAKVKSEITKLKSKRTKESNAIRKQINTLQAELDAIKDTKRNAEKRAGLKSQIIDLERQYTAIVEEYAKKIEEANKPTKKAEEAKNPALKDVESTTKALEDMPIWQEDYINEEYISYKIQDKLLEPVKEEMLEKYRLHKDEIEKQIDVFDNDSTKNVIKKGKELDGSWFSISKGDKKGTYNIVEEGRRQSGFYSPAKSVLNVSKVDAINFIEKQSRNYHAAGNPLMTGKIIAEAYHKAKADGTNPELVKAVKDLLGTPSKTQTPTESNESWDKYVESTAKMLTNSDKKVLINNGFKEVDGMMINGEGERAWFKLSKNTKNLLKKYGIHYIEGFVDFSHLKGGETQHGQFVKIKNGDARGIRVNVSSVGDKFNIENTILHELGHKVYEELDTDLIKQLEIEPITEHGKEVKNNVEDGGKTYKKEDIAEEDFAELFAKNKGDLKAVEELLGTTPQETVGKEDVTKTTKDVPKEVQTKKEVEVKKTSTSFADKIKQRLSDYFVKLAGKSDLIEVGTDKLNEVAVKLGYGDFRAMVLWHGSPHNVDKFSTDKIGTGEGSQSFGWGLYFTELKGIAEYYAHKLSRVSTTYKEEGILQLALEEMRENSIDINTDNVIKYIEDNLIPSYNSGGQLGKDLVPHANSLIATLKVKGLPSSGVYKVSPTKPTDQYTWLEWDKRLTDSQRELILNQAKKEGLPLEEHIYPSGAKGIILKDKKGNIKAIATNGKQIYEWLYQSLGGNILKSDKEVSLFLLRAGIDGVKYPAESISRGKTSDTARGFNYVVFDENAITIDEKIRFLATPSGKIYGMFVQSDPTTHEPKIYLSDEFKAGTLIEEVKHFQYFLMKLAAENGNKPAIKIKEAAETILKPIVDRVIAAQTEARSKVNPQVRTDVEPAETTISLNGEEVKVPQPTSEVNAINLRITTLELIEQSDNRESSTTIKLKETYKDTIVVENISELPKEVVDYIDKLGVTNVTGLEYNGDIYLISSNIQTMGQAEQTYKHEKLGHKNINEYLSKKLSSFASAIIKNADSRQKATIRTIAKEYFNKSINALTKEEKEIIGKEYIARIAEGSIKSPSLLQKIRDFFKKLLRDLGVNLNISDNEIRNIIYKADKSSRVVSDNSAPIIYNNVHRSITDVLNSALKGYNINLNLGGIISQISTSTAANIMREGSRISDKPYYAYAKKKLGETTAKMMVEYIAKAVEASEAVNPNAITDFLLEKIPIKSNILPIMEMMGDTISSDFLAYITTNKEAKNEIKITKKDPFNISREAGYELFEAKNEDDVQSFKTYYRHSDGSYWKQEESPTSDGELICSIYNGGRWKSRYVFFIRSNNWENILPADVLTQENLSDEWKEYLDKNGRKKDDGTYNLKGLRPQREDPYSTSMLSIQINKIGGGIDIISRYNHNVDNPNNTFNTSRKNVDKNYINGLWESLLIYTGFEDKLKDKDNNDLPEGIKLVNNKYYYAPLEVNGEYWGDNFVIANNPTYFDTITGVSREGNVVIFNKDRFITIEGEIYRKGYLGGINRYIAGIPISHIEGKGSSFIANFEDKYHITFKIEHGRIIEVTSDTITDIGNNSLTHLYKLLYCKLPNVTSIGNNSLIANNSLQTLELPNVTSIGNYSLNNNDSLQTLELPNVTSIGNYSLRDNGKNIKTATKYNINNNNIRFSVEDNSTTNKTLIEINDEYGIDLSSEVYRQGEEESNEDYRDRIFDEVWAKLTTNAGVDAIEEIAAKHPTLWNKIKELFTKIQEWFAKSLGLTEQDLSNLSPYELGKQSFNSLMKGEFITSTPLILETREKPDGIIRVGSKQEIFDSLDPEIKEALEKSPQWITLNGLNGLKTTTLKRLAGKRLAIWEKMLIISNSFKRQLSREQVDRFADAELEGVVSYEDHVKLANEYISSIDPDNITTNFGTHIDLRVMDRLFHYFMNHRGKDSQRVMVELSIRFDNIASMLGGLLWAISPNGTLTAITNEMIIRSHGRLFSDILGTKSFAEMEVEMKKVMEDLAMTAEELAKTKEKLKALIVEGKNIKTNITTKKSELIKIGFKNKDVRDAVKKLISKVANQQTAAFSATGTKALFSASSSIENELADVLIAIYNKNSGNLLQAKLEYEEQLKKLENVEGVNILNKIEAKLPLNYNMVDDLIKSTTFKDKKFAEDKVAALNMMERRILGDGKTSKALHQKTTFDYVDNFIKELLSKVSPIANITIDHELLNLVGIQDPSKPAEKETEVTSKVFEFYDKIKATINLYNNGELTLHEMESGVKKLNTEMKKELSKFSMFDMQFPSFQVAYPGSMPIGGSIVKFNNKSYTYNGDTKKWEAVNDRRVIGDEVQERLTKSYLSKTPMSPKYLSDTFDKFKKLVADPTKNEELQDVLSAAYQAIINRGFSKKNINEIEDMIYNAYGVDITGMVATRNMVSDDVNLLDITLEEILKDMYSTNPDEWTTKGIPALGGYNTLAEALVDRLGIDEYNGVKIEEVIKAFLTNEIYPNKEKALERYKKSNNQNLAKESVRLAIHGKLTPMELFPLFAEKYNKSIATPEARKRYSKLVRDWEVAKNPAEKKNARIALQRFFLEHKKEGWTKTFFEGIIQYAVTSMFGTNVLFVSSIPMIATIPERLLMYPIIWAHNNFASKDGRVSDKEMRDIMAKAALNNITELLGKGFPEILEVLITGKGNVTYMSEDNRLQRETWVDKGLIQFVNEGYANTYNHIVNGITKLMPVIYIKRGGKSEELKIDEAHELHPIKKILSEGITNNEPNVFKYAKEILHNKLLAMNIKGSFGVSETKKRKDYEVALRWLEANEKYFDHGRLLTKKELGREVLRDIRILAASVSLSSRALLFRAKTFPVISDIITRMVATPQMVIWNEYFEKRGEIKEEGELLAAITKALGEVEEVDNQLISEGYNLKTKSGRIFAMKRRAEIKEGYRNMAKWDLASRSTDQLTQMERGRDMVGILSNTIADFINNSKALDPSNKSTVLARELTGLAWAMVKITEMAIAPFVLKVGTNVFNFAKYYVPGGLLGMHVLTKGAEFYNKFAEKYKINIHDWQQHKDGTYTNKHLTIKKGDGDLGYSIYKNGNLIQTTLPLNTLHQAKIRAQEESVNFGIPEAYMKYIDPFKSFRGKITSRGIKIEDEFDLTPVERIQLIQRATFGIMMTLALFFQLWDFDEEEETGEVLYVKNDDSPIDIIGDESKNYYADKNIGREPMTITLSLNKLGLKSDKVYQARIMDLPVSSILLPFAKFSDNIYNENQRYGNELRPKHMYPNKMSALFNFIQEATINSIKTSYNTMVYRNLSDLASFATNIGRMEPIAKENGGYTPDKFADRIARSYRQFMLRMVAPNILRDINFTYGGDKITATNKTLKPIADIMYSPNLPLIANLHYGWEQDPKVKDKYNTIIGEWLTSEFAGTIGLKSLLGIEGDFEDNFSFTTRSARGSLMANAPSSKSVDLVKLPFVEQSEFEKWGVKNLIPAEQKYTSEYGLVGLTTNATNTKFIKYVNEKTAEIANDIFMQNIDNFNEGIDSIPLKSNKPNEQKVLNKNVNIIRENKIKFNDAIINKAHNTAIILGMIEMIRDNPQNIEILQYNINSKYIPKDFISKDKTTINLEALQASAKAEYGELIFEENEEDKKTNTVTYNYYSIDKNNRTIKGEMEVGMNATVMVGGEEYTNLSIGKLKDLLQYMYGSVRVKDKNVYRVDARLDKNNRLVYMP